MLPRRAAVGLNRDVHAKDAVQVLQSVALVVRQVVLGDHAGARDPAAELHLRQGGVQYLSPDQIEEDVDPLGAVLLQSVLERGRRSVVEGGIEAELIDEVTDLLSGARIPTTVRPSPLGRRRPTLPPAPRVAGATKNSPP